ncbi:hypothetical protein [Silvibacterium dinghuense]|uniref:Uncharacterized protein n=1 Tax=Silvibacterium dinghuense TaxID=1560006 RepID=A0A4Q1SD54_9BACT|nr:hypothetical protein [Silvibacterium dinghuense]RXS95159.1 hypothetical protein ESZ00_11160 [Silvibacterium dinghuense]GGH11175.1 hypothetical protein GCM10011586_29750 [Silvibacterium dinghuense]
MSSKNTLAWLEEQTESLAARTGAGAAFWPQLQAALHSLAAAEPIAAHVTVAVAEEEPWLLTASAGLFTLKFALDTLSDTLIYSFVSDELLEVLPLESEILHYGVMHLRQSPWGVIDGPDEDVSTYFVDDPQSVQYDPLAEQVARWGLEALLGGFEQIAELEALAAEEEEDEEEEHTHGGGSGH